MSVTPLYAGLLTALYLWLSFRIIGVRRGKRVDMGSGGDPLLERYVRAHGNFAEFAPLSLLLLGLLELGDWPSWLLHLLGLVVLFGRAAHAFAFSVVEPRLRSRAAGMVATLSALGVMALLCLAQALD